MSIGILLINIGTPDKPDVPSVRRYLKEFLIDPRVVDLPFIVRWILLHGIILPTRPKKTARAYQAIWQKEGSPLLLHSQALVAQLQQELGSSYAVALGMRYGQPSIASALDTLLALNCDEIRILPLFPQYASAATGSAIEVVMDYFRHKQVIPKLTFGGDFFDAPFFIQAQAALAESSLAEFKPDHWLLSYHGLPLQHVIASESGEVACDRKHACPTLNKHNRFCYRAQCYATSRALATRLGLSEADYTVAFQSRLGRVPWIKPYTDEELIALRAKGVNHLAVICPSFVADCLETLEEIGLRAKEQWLSLGGQSLQLVPCVNNHPIWVEGLAKGIKAI